jgi:hypothetical protein
MFLANKKIDIVAQSNKIFSIEMKGGSEYGKIRMLDSFNFLSKPLSDLPEMLGIAGLLKGYFPHLANTVENYHIEIPMPAKEAFL